MVDGIQDLSMRFISVEEKKDKESKKVSYTYKSTPNWKDIEEKKQQQETKKGAQPPERPRPRLPHYVEFTMSLWDNNYENAKTFVMTIPIESQYARFEQPEEKKKQGEEKEEEPATEQEESATTETSPPATPAKEAKEEIKPEGKTA
jgi:hypothetical protein